VRLAHAAGCALAQEAYVSNTQSTKNHDPTIRSGRSRLDRAHLGETSPQKRARAEALLARYPELGSEELAGLLHWYRREASAMDVGLLASNEDIRDRYRAFRRDHVERFSLKDKLVGGLLLAGAAAGIAAIGGMELAI
jgi:hypothetical protein